MSEELSAHKVIAELMRLQASVYGGDADKPNVVRTTRRRMSVVQEGFDCVKFVEGDGMPELVVVESEGGD